MINICNPSDSKIILASSSPRRAHLLEQIGIKFTSINPKATEILHKGQDFAKTVITNAELKAKSVIFKDGELPVLGADTLVNFDGTALGKPTDSADAVSMLGHLSGRVHQVYTGIAVINPKDGNLYHDHAVTEVYFRLLTAEEIDDYVCSGDPLDKAGSYGIQGRGALLVEKVHGCFYNVMGLPLTKLWQILQKL